MHQFSGTIPGLDKWPSSNTGRALGPSEAKLVVFQDGGNLQRLPSTKPGVRAPTPKVVGSWWVPPSKCSRKCFLWWSQSQYQQLLFLFHR